MSIKISVFKEYVMVQGTALDRINVLSKKEATKQQDPNFV